MRALILAFICCVTLAVPVVADCPCVPISHLWTVKTCADWNCASTELVLSNGDPQVIAVPTGIDDKRWLVVRRFAAGAAIDNSGDPFELKQFDHMNGAVNAYGAIDGAKKPMLMTAPDGQVLVISLKEPASPKRRATR